MIRRWARLHYGTNVAVLGRQNTPPKDRAFVQMPRLRIHRCSPAVRFSDWLNCI